MWLESSHYFFQLAKNLSFDSLGTLFGISDRLANQIFWSCVRITLSSNIAIPDVLDENTNLESILEDLYESLDPFYKTLYGGLKDPTGIFIEVSVKSNFYIINFNSLNQMSTCLTQYGRKVIFFGYLRLTDKLDIYVSRFLSKLVLFNVVN